MHISVINNDFYLINTTELIDRDDHTNLYNYVLTKKIKNFIKFYMECLTNHTTQHKH